MRLSALLAAAAAIALTATAPAMAAIETFQFTIADPSAGLLSGPYADLTVTEDAGALDFSLSLDNNFRLHGGNFNHDAFAFDLNGDPSINVTGLTSGFSLETSNPSTSEPPFGTFDYAIDCTTACGSGFGGGYSGTLAFKVTSNAGPITLSSLGFETYNSQHIFFTSDVVQSNGNTGNVGALGGVVGGVPEPASWALMILGFGGVGAVMRNRRRTVAATA